MTTEEPEDSARKVEEIVREISDEADKPMDVDPHDDRTREFTSTSLSRMRWEWDPADQQALIGIHELINRQMMVHFGDAYVIMNDLFEIVRTPMVDPTTGEVVIDKETGLTQWVRKDSGAYEEDWFLLGHKDMANFLFRITTGLFAWEQVAEDLRGDSLFAKAVWEEAVAIGYQNARSSGERTVEDRTQAARRMSQDQRLFGIFQTVMSRKADALTRSMQLLGQRLKDVLANS